MIYPKYDRLEELLVGLATDELTSAEEQELKILSANNKPTKDNQGYFQLLKNDLKYLSSENIPTELKGRVITSYKQKVKKIQIVSTLKKLLIFFAGLSGLLIIGNTNRTLQLAIKIPNQTLNHSNPNKQSLATINNNNVFKLTPSSSMNDNEKLII